MRVLAPSLYQEDALASLNQRRHQRTVRVATVQYGLRRIRSFEDFEQQVEFFVDTASEYKSDFVLFPELLTTQLLSFIPSRSPSEAARALAGYTEEYLEFFTDMAVKYNVNVIGGSQFTLEGDRLFNVAYLFRRDGTIERQPKLHVTAEEQRWWGLEAGDEFQVFDTDRGKIAILPSYDVNFPEISPIAAARGAQILFVPSSTDDRTSYLRTRYCAMARAVENDVFVVASGTTGTVRSASSRAVQLNMLFAAAAEVFALACVDAIVTATTVGATPAYRDLCPSAWPG